MSQPHLGDWSVAISLVVAVAAISAIWFSARTQRLAVTERREAQASLVSTWAEDWSHVSEAGEEPLYSNFDAIVCNSGKQPVYQIRISLLRPDWRDDKIPVVSRTIGVLTPESESERISMPQSPGYRDGRSVRPALEIEFTDNRGRRWLRRPDGRLSEVGKPSAFRRLWLRRSTHHR